MPRQPFVVEVAWKTVEQFAADWLDDPWRWSMESDAHAALTSRLASVLEHLGFGRVAAYSQAGPTKRLAHKYSRVSSAPTVALSKSSCRPDIVIWEPAADPHAPPQDALWPVLWACELKYNSAKHRDWDVRKLNALIAEGRASYGCSIRMTQRESSTPVRWELDDHVWKLDVHIRKPTGEDGA